MVSRFLREHPAFLPLEREALGGWQKTFWPQEDGCDGFFVAVLRRGR
jgi:16S rRNA C967 or C1407 C5-methylase (RsmB/RsmF family)